MGNRSFLEEVGSTELVYTKYSGTRHHINDRKEINAINALFFHTSPWLKKKLEIAIIPPSIERLK